MRTKKAQTHLWEWELKKKWIICFLLLFENNKNLLYNQIEWRFLSFNLVVYDQKRFVSNNNNNKILVDLE